MLDYNKALQTISHHIKEIQNQQMQCSSAQKIHEYIVWITGGLINFKLQKRIHVFHGRSSIRVSSVGL